MSLNSIRILESLFPGTEFLLPRKLASQVKNFNIHDISATRSTDSQVRTGKSYVRFNYTITDLTGI